MLFSGDEFSLDHDGAIVLEDSPGVLTGVEFAGIGDDEVAEVDFEDVAIFNGGLASVGWIGGGDDLGLVGLEGALEEVDALLGLMGLNAGEVRFLSEAVFAETNGGFAGVDDGRGSGTTVDGEGAYLIPDVATGVDV